MGLDVYGYVMAAVPYNTVVTTREEVTKVTRYNEETGEPYIKRLKETKTFIGTREVAGGKGDVADALESLGLFSYSRDGDSDYTYVGLKMAEVDYSSPTCSLWFPEDSVPNYIAELKDKLLKIGIKDSKPELVFGLHYSY